MAAGRCQPQASRLQERTQGIAEELARLEPESAPGLEVLGRRPLAIQRWVEGRSTPQIELLHPTLSQTEGQRYTVRQTK